MTSKEAADILNKILEACPEALRAIVEYRKPITVDERFKEVLADVDIVIGQRNGVDTLGPLGLLQAFVKGHIAVVLDDDGNIERFEQWEPGEDRGAVILARPNAPSDPDKAWCAPEAK